MRKIFCLLSLLLFIDGSSQAILLLGSSSKIVHIPSKTFHEVIPKDHSCPLGPVAKSLYLRSQIKRRIRNKSSRQGLWIQYENQFVRYDRSEIQTKKRLLRQKRPLNSTIKKIGKLERRSAYARNIIKTLQNSTNFFVIKISECAISYMVLPIDQGRKGALNNDAYAFQIMESDSTVADYALFEAVGSGAEIRWNHRNSLICLAHELAHAYDANYGLLDNRILNVNGETMIAREIRAIYHENNIRREMKRPYRESAQGIRSWIVDGKPITYVLPEAARR